MRNIILSMVMAVAFALAGHTAASAAAGSGGQLRDAIAVESIVKQVQGYCETLRRACENKDQLGERGEGNCRRYRESCGGGGGGGYGYGGGYRESFQQRCARLRRACIYKDERGESGEGNCRRYRNECRGGGGY